MRLDYSPAEPGPRVLARRALLLAGFVFVVAGALLSRIGVSGPGPSAAPAADAPLSPGLAAATLPEGAASAQSALAAMPVPEVAPAAPASQWVTLTIKRGEALSTLIESIGLPKSDWVPITAMGEYGKRLRMLRAGETIRLRKQDAHLQELLYELGETQTLHIKRTAQGDRYEGFIIAKALERRPTFATGVIDSSLFVSGQQAGLSSAVIMELADVFGYDIDFAQDMRPGDRFTVIYEEVWKDGKKLRDGGILAAEFVNQKQPYRAVRYTDPAGNTAFYDSKGQSLRKAFRRSPLDVMRVTSSFSLARRHPVLNKIRAHKGTDYGAAWGTPIKATGDGRVSFMGNKGGYGKVVILRHGAATETLYAHMSRFRPGLGVGSRVQQGQVIGYVGASGLATAAHLHYEFRVNGIHKNPMKVQLPRGNALPTHLFDEFQQATSPLLAQLDSLSRTQFAQAN